MARRVKSTIMVSSYMDKVEAAEVFDGVMLGDGSITLPSSYNNAYFIMNLSGTKTLEYLSSVRTALLTLSIPVKTTYPKVLKGTSKGKVYYYCRLQSGCCQLLTEQYHRWYPSRRKVVPEDVSLTPITLAHWFMGDGSSYLDERYHYVSVTITLCTDGYREQEVALLADKLHSININVSLVYHTAVRNGRGMRIIIRQDSVNRFMDVVGPYVIEPYEYKLKYKEVPDGGIRRQRKTRLSINRPEY